MGYAVQPLHIIINYVSRVPLPAPATMTDDRYHHKTESRLITGNLSSAMFVINNSFEMITLINALLTHTAEQYII